MSNAVIRKHTLRQKRKYRVRKNIHGTATSPRMCVIKSNKHVKVQLIDDDAHVTLASYGTDSKELQNTDFNCRNKASAKVIGEKIAQKAAELNIKEVKFDRGCFKYHGILAELADAARAGGLQF